MSFSLANAVVYDIETFPNCFTFAMEMLHSDVKGVWEISEYRDDRVALMQFFDWMGRENVPMIGFNNIHFDYPVIHLLRRNPQISYQQLYAKAMAIIESFNQFEHTIWANDRFTPQIDLRKLHHLDNKAKMTSLKALQVNMRSPSVEESAVPFGINVDPQQIFSIIGYNEHDVSETKRFAQFSMSAIQSREKLIEQFGIDVLNWNDTKIGEQIIIQRLGEDRCYTRDEFGKRQMLQTPRHRIALGEIIFPIVRFETAEFQRIHQYLQAQVLTAEQIKDLKGEDTEELDTIVTKGVFTGLTATAGGITYHYGVGGIHGSVERKQIKAGGGYLIRDIDVAALYPSIAIKNNLAPEHLGNAFVKVYAELPEERKRLQKLYGKKSPEANAMKLASNGVYGKSNSKYSPFYDPQFTMTITVNGQLLLSMLVEQLIKIPTLSVIQANTDGISYYIHEDYEPFAKEVCKWWEGVTKLTLEDADYAAMYIRDVNNYIAVGKDGAVKLKGAYWTPDPCNYHESIANAQPVSWHKNFSNVVSVRAAVAYMTQGVDIEQYIRMCTNPYDFMNAVKIQKSHKLLWAGIEQQKNCRFYVSTDGKPLIKRFAPKDKPLGAFKKAPKISDHEYNRVMAETNGAWDARVCTQNKSTYEISDTGVIAGNLVTLCNHVNDFGFF